MFIVAVYPNDGAPEERKTVIVNQGVRSLLRSLGTVACRLSINISSLRDLRIARTTVFARAPILGELDEEENDRGPQKEMNHAALVQQKFRDNPDDQEQSASEPQHEFRI